MASKKLYDYIVPRLASEIERVFSMTLNYKNERNTFKDYGKYDKIVSKRRIAEISEYFCKCSCRENKSEFLISADLKTIYCYNSAYYEQVGGIDFIEEVVKRVMYSLGIGAMYIVDTPSRVCKDIFRLLKNTDELIFNPDRNYIIFSNGVFRVDTGDLLAFSKQYVTDIILDFPYMKSEDLKKIDWESCNLWDKTIGDRENGVIPDFEMRKAFQMFCGSFLVDRSKLKIEYICYLYGSGSNGKSVLAQAIQNVFGEKYFSFYTPKQLLRDSDARNAIAGLRGKIANIVGDLDAKDMSGGDFKRLVSGEKMQGRENYGTSIAVAAPPLLCCTNTLPESRDDTYGHHRRQLVIQTTKKQWTEKDKDPYLVRKLSVQVLRQYIFTWIYEGYKMIIQNNGNFDFGERVVDLQRDYMEENSTIRRWFYCSDYDIPQIGDDDVKVRSKDLYKAYSQWCLDQELAPRKMWEFGGVLRDIGLNPYKIHGVMYYGIKYKKAEFTQEELEDYEKADDSIWDNIGDNEIENEEITKNTQEDETIQQEEAV